MKKINLALILLFVFISSGAQNKTVNSKQQSDLTIEQLQQDVETLQKQNKEQNDIIRSLKDSISHVKNNAQKAEEVYQTAKEIYEIKDIFITWLIPLLLTIASLLGIGYWTKLWVSKLTKSNMKEIKRLATNERWGIDLREKAFILIINKEGSTLQSNVDKITKTFNNREIININNLKKDELERILKDKNIKINKDELTIFIIDDNIDEMFPNDEEKKAFINFLNKNNIGILLYGKGQLPDYELKGFANNPYSLYTNLMNLLKYISLFRK